MSNTKHHRFDALYRRFATYGREIPTDGTEKCPDEITLAMSALIRIVGVVDSICLAIAHNECRMAMKDIHSDCERSADKWIKEKQLRHGPMPWQVHGYIYSLARTRAEHIASCPELWDCKGVRYINVFPSEMPAEVRKEYDRWRKRKAKKESAK